MITLLFTLSGLFLLVVQVLATDFLRLRCRMAENVADSFGHDSKVFPDFQGVTE